MKMIKKMLCIVITLAILLSGCGQTRETKKTHLPKRNRQKSYACFTIRIMKH